MGCLGIKIKFHLSPLCDLVLTSLEKIQPNLGRGSCPRDVTWGCLGFKNQILSRRLSVISPPESLDQIQPNEVCELLTCMGRATAKK